jgi:hypothetical protein
MPAPHRRIHRDLLAFGQPHDHNPPPRAYPPRRTRPQPSDDPAHQPPPPSPPRPYRQGPPHA